MGCLIRSVRLNEQMRVNDDVCHQRQCEMVLRIFPVRSPSGSPSLWRQSTNWPAIDVHKKMLAVVVTDVAQQDNGTLRGANAGPIRRN